MSRIVSDEQLSAYIDGELSAGDSQIIDAALDTDDALAARLARLESIASRIRDRYSAIDTEPMPDKILEMLGESDDKTNSRVSTKLSTLRSIQGVQPKTYWPSSLAASVALLAGIAIGTHIAKTGFAPNSDPVLASSDTVTSEIDELLNTTLSGASVDTHTGQFSPMLSFRSHDGAICREYELRADTSSSRAIACRHSNTWKLRIVAYSASNLTDKTQYSPASSAEEKSFADVVSSMMAADALSADEEREVLSNWH